MVVVALHVTVVAGEDDERVVAHAALVQSLCRYDISESLMPLLYKLQSRIILLLQIQGLRVLVHDVAATHLQNSADPLVDKGNGGVIGATGYIGVSHGHQATPAVTLVKAIQGHDRLTHLSYIYCGQTKHFRQNTGIKKHTKHRLSRHSPEDGLDLL